MRKCVKIASAFVLSASLLLCNVSSAFAAYTPFTSGLKPYTYLFALALSYCAAGADAGDRIDSLYASYKQYLTKLGNSSATSALSKLSAIESANWGDSQIQFNSVCSNTFISWASRAGLRGDSESYTLSFDVKSPDPVEWVDMDTLFSLQAEPYDIPGYESHTLYTSDAYEYLFSDTYAGGGSVYKRNTFIPTGTDIFGIINYTSNSDIVTVRFYAPSGTDGSYVEQKVYSMQGTYNMETHANTGTTASGSARSWTYLTTSLGYASQLPFPVFESTADAEEYCRTGVATNALKADKRNYVIKGTPYNVSNYMSSAGVSYVTLPASADEAALKLDALVNATDENFPYAFMDAGVDVEFYWQYIIEYYQDGELVETQMASTPLDSPVIDSVPLSVPDGYEAVLDLPFTVSLTDKVIQVYYQPLASDISSVVVDGVSNTVDDIKGFVVPILPYGLGVVTVGGIGWTFLRILKRIVMKA